MRALPEPRPYEGGVYFLWLANELVYIGRSQNILWRLEIVRTNTKYGAKHYYFTHALPFDRVTFIAFEAETKEQFHYLTKDHERAYIATYLPSCNSDYKNAGNGSF